jgi:hypothetical protein
MTVSNAQIWKAVSASGRPASQTADRNIHIGQTLKDLYFNGDMPSTEGRFQQLLHDLDLSERKRDRH